MGAELTVLCAGDRFITAAAFAEEARRVLGQGVEILTHESAWPDVPFGAEGTVREAAGDVDDLLGLVRRADVLLTHLAPVTDRVPDAAERLRVVGSVRGGPVNVDLDAATRNHVPVLYLPGRNLEAVAEFTLGSMIALTRRMVPASRDLSGGTWDASWFRIENTGPELSSSTVGLVGLGAVGLRVTELLTAFGTTVVAHDPYADQAAAARAGVELLELPDLLGRSDIVSLHARATAQTRHLIDAETVAMMRPGAYLVNTARGELVDRAAVAAALESGHLAGAALDVHDPEPPQPDDPLVARRDVVATPHLAGASRQVAEHSVARAVAAVERYLSSGEADPCANPQWAGSTPAGADGDGAQR